MVLDLHQEFAPKLASKKLGRIDGNGRIRRHDSFGDEVLARLEAQAMAIVL